MRATWQDICRSEYRGRWVALDNVRLHDLRHFAATRLLAAGVPVRTVSGRLGHANAPTLAATTARLTPAWRSMVFLALATIDDGLAATIADNELDRILLRECRP